MPTQVFEMTDNDFLQWIYNRMVEVHNENELYDYMHKFKGIIEKNKMTEKDKNQMVRLCKDCKYYKDYDGVFDWISSRIFGFPTLQKCFHPNRVKIVDYVNGTTCPYTTCSTERSYGNCGIMRNNWEAKE